VLVRFALVMSVIFFTAPALGADSMPTPVPPSVKKAEPPISASAVEKRITSMREVLKRLLKELASARQANDVRRVNCLLAKLNLVKGLLKASERAQVVMLEATYGNDAATTQVYGKKIMTYGGSADEIERSIAECSGVEVRAEGTSLVYIRPDEPEIQTGEETPWDGSDVTTSGPESYPVVPPASPYR
jgi:hypothetical protein